MALILANAFKNIKDNYEMVPIVHAASANEFEIVKLLVQSGVDPNSTGFVGIDALIYASFFGHYNIVQYLLSVGADVNATNDFSQDALYAAAEAGNLDVAKLLIS
jgi:ankyrin repeat domain-containing protein 50